MPEIETGMVNLHPLQIEDMTQHGPAVNTNNVPNPEPAPHSEGQEKSSIKIKFIDMLKDRDKED